MGKYKVVVLSPVPEALIKMWVTPVAHLSPSAPTLERIASTQLVTKSVLGGQ